MWGRIPGRALERTGWRAPGAAIGWTVVVALLLVIPATQLGLYPGGEPSEETVGIPRDELVLGPTVNSPSAVSTIDDLDAESVTSTPNPDPDSPPEETPATAGPAGPVTAPSTTSDSTSDTTTMSVAPLSSTTIPSTASTTGSPTTSASATTAAPAIVPSSTTTTSASTSTTSVSTSTSTSTGSTTTTTTATTTTSTLPTTSATPSNFAVGDAYRVTSGKTEQLRVLGNDGDQEMLDRSTLEIVVAPRHADRYEVRGNHIQYVALDDYVGSDSLRYRVCTFDGVCASADVAIQVTDG